MEDKKTVSLRQIMKIVGAILIAVFLIIAFRNMFSAKDKTSLNGNAIVNSDEVQVINLGFRNYNYYPNNIEVESGRPVKLIANMKEITGCYRALVMPQLNIRKYFKENDNILEFIPTQKGTIPFSCIMGMGTGNLIVK